MTRNPQVFFEIKIGSEAVGKMVFELFADVVPKTAENFRCLCTGEKSPKLHYKNSIFHRVIKGFMAQGGDITHRNGTGCVSIYGRKGALKDENVTINHSERGLLSMANSGPNSSGCQFFITFTATPHLDGKHVVFGKLISGMEVLQKMEAIATYRNNQPINKCTTTIINCGEVTENQKPTATPNKDKEGTNIDNLQNSNGGNLQNPSNLQTKPNKEKIATKTEEQETEKGKTEKSATKKEEDIEEKGADKLDTEHSKSKKRGVDMPTKDETADTTLKAKKKKIKTN